MIKKAEEKKQKSNKQHHKQEQEKEKEKEKEYLLEDLLIWEKSSTSIRTNTSSISITTGT